MRLGSQLLRESCYIDDRSCSKDMVVGGSRLIGCFSCIWQWCVHYIITINSIQWTLSFSASLRWPSVSLSASRARSRMVCLLQPLCNSADTWFQPHLQTCLPHNSPPLEDLPDLNLRNGTALSFLQLFLKERNADGTSKVDPPLRVCLLHEGSMSRSVEMHSCTWNMKYCTWIWHVSLHHIIGDFVLSVGFGGWVFSLVRVSCHRMFRHSSVLVP